MGIPIESSQPNDANYNKAQVQRNYKNENAQTDKPLFEFTTDDETQKLIHNQKWGRKDNQTPIDGLKDGAQYLAEGGIDLIGSGLKVMASGILKVTEMISPSMYSLKNNINETKADIANALGIETNIAENTLNDE